jgi:predicted lipid-binding transport protein (Tim44 family)
MQRMSPALAKACSCLIAVGALLFFSYLLFESCQAFARAGDSGGAGGGSSLSYQNRSMYSLASYVISFAVLALASLHAFGTNRKINRRREEVSKALSEMSQLEQEWSEDRLESQVRQKFLLLQEAWSRQDLQTIKTQLKDDLYAYWQAELAKQISENQRTHIEKVTIQSVRIIAVRNHMNNEADEFTASIDATCHERLISLWSDPLVKRQGLRVDRFREFWTFQREHDQWKLKDVRQFSAWSRLVSAEIVDELRAKNATRAPDTPALRLSSEKRLLGEKVIAKKCVIILCLAVFFPLFAFAFFEPVNMLDSLLKNMMISAPLSYLFWSFVKERVLKALEEADARQHIATLAFCATIVAGLSVPMCLTIVANALGDRSDPHVVSTTIIYKSSYTRKGSYYYKVVMAAPETSGCCLVPSKTLTLSVSRGEYDAVEVGKSKASLAIKVGFLGMPYVTQWSLLSASLNSGDAERPDRSGKTVGKKWSEAALAAKKWNPRTPAEAAAEYRVTHWPNGTLQSKEPLYQGLVHCRVPFCEWSALRSDSVQKR